MFRAAILLCGLCGLLCACGYEFSARRGAGLPAIPIAVATFSNDTLQTGVEIPFTQALIDRLAAQHRFQIVSERNARWLISAEVDSFQIRNLAYIIREVEVNGRKGDIPLPGDKEVKIVATIKVKEIDSGKMLLDETAFSAKRNYFPDEVLDNEQAAQRDAIALLAREIADDMASRLRAQR